jgi:hypothetical protein
MTTTNLETILLKVPAPIPRQDPKLAYAYMRSLQPAVKSKDLLVVPRGGFEVRSKILGYKELTQSITLILSGSFVSATLSNINIFAIIIPKRNYAYLRGFNVDLAAVAEELDVY